MVMVVFVRWTMKQLKLIMCVFNNDKDVTDASFDQDDVVPPLDADSEESCSSFDDESSDLDSSSIEDETSKDSEEESTSNSESPRWDMSEQELHGQALASFVV